MQDYESTLRWKLMKYKKMHPENDRLTALRFAMWNLRFFLFGLKGPKMKLDPKVLNIAFLVSGGLGDFLVGFNYIAKFDEYFKDIPKSIHVYAEQKKVGMARSFYDGTILEDSNDNSGAGYDLFISLVRYPRIVIADRKRLEEKSSQLMELVDVYREFERSRMIFFTAIPYGDGLTINHSLCEGKIRLQQPDIDGRLGIGTDYFAPIPYPNNDEAILNRLGLPENFITLNRGVDAGLATSDNTKMWPLEYYNKLIPLLKQYYPDIPLVQIGVSVDRSPLMDDIDISLVGKTSIDDLKVVLKYSQLHIDGEGGMVHLRHALHAGPSVVLFGPTCREFYGYDENLNLHSKVCSWCEWTSDSWNQKCLRTGSKAECMQALTPDNVMEEIRKFIP